MARMHTRLLVGTILSATVALLALSSTATAELSSRTAETPRSDPAVFVSHVVSLIVSDDYAHAWTSLYPPHKRVAPRREYVGCERRNPVSLELEYTELIGVRDHMIHIPGQTTAVKAKLVTLRITVKDPVSGTQTTFTHAFRAIPVGTHWTWILTERQYELYRDDSC